MSDEQNIPPGRPRPALLRNWVSLSGLVIGIGSLFSFLFLLVLNTLSGGSNPYVGILTFVVAPGFLIFGLVLAGIGAWRARRKIGHTQGVWPSMVIDFSNPRDRRRMGYFLAGAVLFLLLSAVGSYHTYHFSESVTFCGQACHTVMKPEFVTYQHGSHARVACVECHIGSGATWFVKSKLSGTYQLYAVAFNKYPRPVPTPIKNLRPAQETCEQCHWPEKFVGNLDRTYDYFLGDETNTPFSVRMTIKVGGGDPTHGQVGGIHWHMNVANKVEYYASDESRQTIPWVRVTNPQGVVTEYRVPNFTNQVASSLIRRMDCMDCHNRPAHTYETPNAAVNLAISLGKIDRALPWAKTNAVFVLTQSYTNESQALQTIATHMADQYPAARFPEAQASVRRSIQAVQQIYTNNFFPEMNASWDKYPNNIGHKDWLGCFRCHDGRHKTLDGQRTITANDCNACHTILAQGSGEEMNLLTPNGQEFKHPGGEVDGACNDCHTGGL